MLRTWVTLPFWTSHVLGTSIISTFCARPLRNASMKRIACLQHPCKLMQVAYMENASSYGGVESHDRFSVGDHLQRTCGSLGEPDHADGRDHKDGSQRIEIVCRKHDGLTIHHPRKHCCGALRTNTCMSDR